MRLIDRILQHTKPVAHQSASGEEVMLTDLVRAKDSLGACALRYVLDPQSSEQCTDLVTEAPALFNPDDPFLRISSPEMWLEFFTFDDLSSRLIKVGALVRADPSGRSGTIQGFFETQAGHAAMDHGIIIFDLDKKLPSDEKSFRLRQATVSHLNPLFDHALVTLRPETWALIKEASSLIRKDLFEKVANGCWLLLPVVLSFSAMVNSGGILRERVSDLDRLNRARAKGRKPPLADHIEVSLDLGFSRISSSENTSSSVKASPRLHYVRGHVVRRSGKTFWRSSHLRGVGDALPLTRTVKFRSISN